jgi:hypothetical protein
MRARGIAFAAALALASIFFADVCDLVFRCGCRSLWTLLRFGLALLSFPLTAGVVGAIQGFLWEYWAR